MPWITRPAVAVLAGAATTGALVLLMMPGHYVPHEWFAHQDKVEHAGTFALLCLLWRWAGVPLLRLMMCAVAIAVVTEVLQAVMGMGRSGDPLDALVDVVGAALGVAVWAMACRSRAPGRDAP